MNNMFSLLEDGAKAPSAPAPAAPAGGAPAAFAPKPTSQRSQNGGGRGKSFFCASLSPNRLS